MKRVGSTAVLTGGACLLLFIACGARDATEVARQIDRATEVVVEGGATPFQARLSFMSPEGMAIQEVPYRDGDQAWGEVRQSLSRYRNQWAFRLTLGPKPGTSVDPNRPFALDIENNGGQWGDHGRNLQRLMFEMNGFIRLVLPDGKEIEPRMVEFQRSFGMGRDRSFMVIFPKQFEGHPLKPPFIVRVAEFGQGTGTMEFSVRRSPAEQGESAFRRTWKGSRVE